MSFGLYNRLAFFQHYINNTLWDYLDNFCMAYLDIILIFSEDEREHELHVKKVLTILWDAGLQVDITKSQFHISGVVYFGLIITTGGIQMNLTKVNTIIIHRPAFKNVKDIWIFWDLLVFTNVLFMALVACTLLLPP